MLIFKIGNLNFRWLIHTSSIIVWKDLKKEDFQCKSFISTLELPNHLSSMSIVLIVSRLQYWPFKIVPKCLRIHPVLFFTSIQHKLDPNMSYFFLSYNSRSNLPFISIFLISALPLYQVIEKDFKCLCIHIELLLHPIQQSNHSIFNHSNTNVSFQLLSILIKDWVGI